MGYYGENVDGGHEQEEGDVEACHRIICRAVVLRTVKGDVDLIPRPESPLDSRMQ
ncbi:hypothetical protein [Micromonospora sp. IBSANI012]|uniref:hypothetical protein n=1 Tax=Micromonospora sp. IBSANI012 TaxID=3457761 RepID=UPI004059FBA2